MAACGHDESKSSVRNGDETDVPSDQAQWKTYESPLGFSMRYPPSWKVETYDGGLTKILNEKRQVQTAIEGGDSGEAWVEIGQDAIPSYDAQALRESCESGGSGVATGVTLAGRTAVHCMWPDDGKDVYSGLPSWGQVYWVNFPPAHALSLVTYAIDTDRATHELLNSILATISFEVTP